MVFVKKVVLYIEAVSPCLKIIYEDAYRYEDIYIYI